MTMAGVPSSAVSTEAWETAHTELLTFLREIIRRSPAESTVYLGDNARAPYGVRSDAEVLDFSIESLDLLAQPPLIWPARR